MEFNTIFYSHIIKLVINTTFFHLLFQVWKKKIRQSFMISLPNCMILFDRQQLQLTRSFQQSISLLSLIVQCTLTLLQSNLKAISRNLIRFLMILKKCILKQVYFNAIFVTESQCYRMFNLRHLKRGNIFWKF